MLADFRQRIRDLVRSLSRIHELSTSQFGAFALALTGAGLWLGSLGLGWLAEAAVANRSSELAVAARAPLPRGHALTVLDSLAGSQVPAREGPLLLRRVDRGVAPPDGAPAAGPDDVLIVRLGASGDSGPPGTDRGSAAAAPGVVLTDSSAARIWREMGLARWVLAGAGDTVLASGGPEAPAGQLERILSLVTHEGGAIRAAGSPTGKVHQ